jgi:RimJ/RimL family protein N-acetyltransferase
MFDILAPEDIPELMRLERLPGYEAFIGRWSAEEHAAEMASPAARYRGWREGGRLAGFTIFQKFDQPVIQLRRIAIAEPGGGAGTRLLRAALAWVFETTGAEAVDLQVMLDNARAKRVYLREGFVVEGEGAPGHERMVLARAAWEAQPRGAA